MATEPVWLTELLDAAEKQEGEHKAQLSKVSLRSTVAKYRGVGIKDRRSEQYRGT